MSGDKRSCLMWTSPPERIIRRGFSPCLNLTINREQTVSTPLSQDKNELVLNTSRSLPALPCGDRELEFKVQSAGLDPGRSFEDKNFTVADSRDVTASPIWRDCRGQGVAMTSWVCDGFKRGAKSAEASV